MPSVSPSAMVQCRFSLSEWTSTHALFNLGSFFTIFRSFISIDCLTRSFSLFPMFHPPKVSLSFLHGKPSMRKSEHAPRSDAENAPYQHRQPSTNCTPESM